MTPAGLGGCVIEMMERGPRRLRHLDRRESVSRPALRAEFHAAPRLAVPRRRRALQGGRDPHLRRAVPGDGAARNRRVHPRLHRPIRPERAGRDLGIPLPARPGSARARPGCEEHSVVARAAAAGVPLYTSSPGDSSIGMNIAYHELMNDSRFMIDPNKDVNEVCAIMLAGKTERLRDSRRRLAEEFLSAGAADALGGLRHPEGRQRVLHPDHDRFRWCGAACPARRRPRR